jgi:fumarate reductase subunit D
MPGVDRGKISKFLFSRRVLNFTQSKVAESILWKVNDLSIWKMLKRIHKNSYLNSNHADAHKHLSA